MLLREAVREAKMAIMIRDLVEASFRESIQLHHCDEKNIEKLLHAEFTQLTPASVEG